MLDDARTYARIGWRVFPVYEIDQGICSCWKGNQCGKDSGKHPRIQNWQHQATTDETIIEAWWQQWPDASIGIVAGKASGIWVLDVDPRNEGDDTLHEWERQYGALPATPCTHTGSGGAHYYFQSAGSIPKIRDVAPGIDVQGEGSYVLAPPSSHMQGSYIWDVVYDYTTSCVDAPLWLLELIAKAQTAKAQTVHTDREVREGGRHAFLFDVALDLRRQGIYEDIGRETVIAVNTFQCKPPQPLDEVRKLVADVWGRYQPNIHATVNGQVQRSSPSELLERYDVEILDWIWEPYFVRNKFTILDGDPGVGKSTFLMKILALITRGDRIPGTNEYFTPLDVVYATMEDGIADTVRPRFEVAGGDLSRMHILQEFHSVNDLAYWEWVFKHHAGAILVLDPLMTFLQGDGNKASDVLNILQPWTNIAEQHQITPLGTRHLGKSKQANAMYQGLGSMSFAGIARSMLLMGTHPDDDDVAVVAQTKASLAKMGEAIRLRRQDYPHPGSHLSQKPVSPISMFVFDGVEQITAQQLLSKPEAENTDQTMDVDEFLQEMLRHGPVPASTVFKAAEQEGINEKTLKRHKKALGIVSYKEGKSWSWVLQPTVKI